MGHEGFPREYFGSPQATQGLYVSFNNFAEVLPSILDDLEGCDFVAIDFAMTGIELTDPRLRSNYGDTPEVR